MKKTSIAALTLATSFTLADCSPQPESSEANLSSQDSFQRIRTEGGYFNQRIQLATQRAQRHGRDLTESQMREIAREQARYEREGGELPPCEAEWMFYDGYRVWWEKSFKDQEVGDYICGGSAKTFCTAAFDIGDGAYVIAWINQGKDAEGLPIATLAANGDPLTYAGTFRLGVTAEEPELMAKKTVRVQQWNKRSGKWEPREVSYAGVAPNCENK